MSEQAGEEASELTVRSGTVSDAATVLGLFDDAVRWLTVKGQTGQWGTTPFSESPKRVLQVERWCGSGGLHIAERSGEAVGALVLLPEAPDYVPVSDEPELYVIGLVSGRQAAARGAGRALLETAHQKAVAAGVSRLRVDCWAGGDGALVDFYVSAGFTRLHGFEVGDWPGQVLERRLRRHP
ncbi:GNAT family N-acetyltransferase [Allokutzneria sp. NRRL B-24872]|uniref:GNAT family N-acetyltransferase n=1 Tax=Allokutzneria sp. NRRL B-24872 TaxID=1137961 RepID=UPI001AEFBD2B|nr:GNAT family N-acetyltransferase [Allokutzneria sp. NRRL B-24872]